MKHSYLEYESRSLPVPGYGTKGVYFSLTKQYKYYLYKVPDWENEIGVFDSLAEAMSFAEIHHAVGA